MIIYVPQGHSARLVKESKHYGISGMLTDDFSICNIVACFSPNSQRMVLMHVDLQATSSISQEEQILESIKWVGEDAEIIIFYRTIETDNYKPGCDGKFIKDKLLKIISNVGILPKLETVSDDKDGIYVSFDLKDNYAVYRKNELEAIQQNTLINHPQEQQLTSVRKICQIIGLKAKVLATKHKDSPYTFNLFDGRGWEPVYRNELEIDISSAITKDEMNLFQKGDSRMMIARKVAYISQMLRKHIEVIKEDRIIGLEISPNVEDYLYDFDYKLIFKQNLLDVLNDSNYAVPESTEDKNFYRKCNAALRNELISFEEVSSIFFAYESILTPETKFNKIILAEFAEQIKRYHQGKYYDELKDRYSAMKSTAKDSHKRGVALYKEGKFSAAAEMFFVAIENLSICALKSDADLASAYFNCGKCFVQLGDDTKAVGHLGLSLYLRKNYTLPKPSTEQLEKTEKAYMECREKFPNPPNPSIKKRNYMH